MTDLSSIVAVLIAAVGTVLPGILKQDRFSDLANGLIAGAVVLIASVASAYAKDQFGPSFAGDFSVILIIISALLAGPLKDLDVFLQANVLAGHKPAIIQVITPRTSVVTQATGVPFVPGQYAMPPQGGSVIAPVRLSTPPSDTQSPDMGG